MRFKCLTDEVDIDYDVTVSTATIEYIWERFECRVKTDALSYCYYRSSREGTLSLVTPKELAKGVHKGHRTGY